MFTVMFKSVKVVHLRLYVISLGVQVKSAQNHSHVLNSKLLINSKSKT